MKSSHVQKIKEIHTQACRRLRTAPAPASPVRATLEPTPELDAPDEDRATEIDTDTDTHATAVADAMNLEESYIIRIREEAELAEQTE